MRSFLFLGAAAVAGHLPSARVIRLAARTGRQETMLIEPEQFRPERRKSDLPDRLPRFAYSPFDGVPRHRVGQAFAMMETLRVR